jgi:hypothetical protein
MENYNYDNVIGGEIGSESFPFSLSSTRQEPSAEDDMMAEKRRKKAVARFVALTTSAAATAASVVSLPDSAVSQTLDRIVRVVSTLEEEIITEYKVKILSTKEVRSDELVAKIVQAVEAQIPPHLSAEERRETLERAVLAKLSAASSCLHLKLNRLFKSFMTRREEAEMDGLFYNYLVPQKTRRELSSIYGTMFDKFIGNDRLVSFATGNPRMLGNIAPVDMWFLTFFVFVTCRRIRGDKLLQLGCVGKSSCGKSTILEAVIRQTAHELLSSTSQSGGDAGVGRFEVGKKNMIFLHDVAIGKFFGVDFEKLKAISRAEPTAVKIHGHVTNLPPLHLFYTRYHKQLARVQLRRRQCTLPLFQFCFVFSSNGRMQTHSIRVPNLFASVRAAAAIRNRKRKRSNDVPVVPVDDPSNWTIRTVESQVQDALSGGIKKHFGAEDLAAVKNRFLELYVHKVPPQEEAHVNLAEVFDRFHFIVGTFERALSTLEKYSPADFPSQHLYGYAIGALRKNALYYEEVLNGTIDGEVNDNGADDDDDDDLFFDGGGDDKDDDDDDDDDDRRRRSIVIRDEDDKFQKHYIRIFELAKKYGVH